MSRLTTFADFVRLRYGLACECPKCGRSVRLNLAGLVMRGRGDQRVHRTRPLCSACGAVGTYRIIPPLPPAPSRPKAESPGPPQQRGGIWGTPGTDDRGEPDDKKLRGGAYILGRGFAPTLASWTVPCYWNTVNRRSDAWPRAKGSSRDRRN